MFFQLFTESGYLQSRHGLVEMRRGCDWLLDAILINHPFRCACLPASEMLRETDEEDPWLAASFASFPSFSLSTRNHQLKRTSLQHIVIVIPSRQTQHIPIESSSPVLNNWEIARAKQYKLRTGRTGRNLRCFSKSLVPRSSPMRLNFFLKA